MKIAVCDDDNKELDIIKNYLNIYQTDNNTSFTVKYFNSSVELASTAGFEKFDIYFLISLCLLWMVLHLPER